jgi:hypothetical protein
VDLLLQLPKRLALFGDFTFDRADVLRWSGHKFRTRSTISIVLICLRGLRCSARSRRPEEEVVYRETRAGCARMHARGVSVATGPNGAHGDDNAEYFDERRSGFAGNGK